MKHGKACRQCRMVIEEGDKCPVCGGISFTTFWRGYVVITDAEKSEIAQKMGINTPGKYALRLSR
jgi:DNA-directed RNA polymerase subunit E"